MQQGFLIPPNADKTKRQREIAAALMKQGGKPRYASEGLGEAAKQIIGALMTRSADKKDDAARAAIMKQVGGMTQGVDPRIGQAADMKAGGYLTPGMQAMLKAAGIPGYAGGVRRAPGGMAMVGEMGPELMQVPPGANIYPAQGQQPPMPQPPGFNPQDAMLQGGDGRDEMVGGEGGDQIEISGVGEQSQLNAAARAFQGLMTSLQGYEDAFKDKETGGSTMWPGTKRDRLAVAHRDLQMQMKELYNLGVLNGPDLELMNSILLDPTSVGGNVMDVLGIADMEKRIPENIEQVRQLMLNRTMPALQQLGIDPQSLMPGGGESDEDFLKRMLGGG